MAYCDEGNQEIPDDHRREVVAAEDIEAEDLVYLKPDGTVGLSYGTKRRRERSPNDFFQWALEIDENRHVGPEEQRVFDTISALLELHNARMKGTEEPIPEPPRAEDAAEDQSSSDGLTWRQQPGLL